MTEREQDIRDLDTLWESVSRDLLEMSRNGLSQEELEQIRLHAQWAIEEGQAIFKRLNQGKPSERL